VDEYEERSPDKSTTGFLEQVSLVADSDEIESGPHYVTLMTVHLAKGLEFNSVFLTGMEEGLFPIGETDFAQDELEEERRLCYVGMTRAKRMLHLTWSASRRLYGHSRWNAPSRFIEEAGLVAKPTSRPISAPGPVAPRASSKTYSVDSSPKASSTVSASPLASPPSPFAVGSRVRHTEFGEGKVIEKSGSGDNLKVMVLFTGGQWKKLLVKYAGLEPL